MQARHRLQQVRSMGMYQTMVPWLPVAVGIGIMVGLLVYGVTLQAGERPSLNPPVDTGQAYSPLPITPPGATVDPAGPPAQTVAPTEPPATTPPPPPEPPPPAPAPPPPPPELAGTYVLKESFRDSFVAKVVVTNESHDPQDWTVKLRFPDNVGGLKEFWVDGTEQPDVDRVHDTFVFTSAVPLPGQSHVVLKVQFVRYGQDVEPEVCKVNEASCQL